MSVLSELFFAFQSPCVQSVGPLVMPSLCCTLKIILRMQRIQAEGKKSIQMLPSTHIKGLISQGLLKHGFWFTDFYLGKEDHPIKALGKHNGP